MNRRGFTLVELLVSISIIALLLVLATSNFLGARERARDVKVKGELNQLKKALRVYYNDHQGYPPEGLCGAETPLQNTIAGCGTDGKSCCPCTVSGVSYGFATGATCDPVYMRKFPADRVWGDTIKYYVSSDKERFCIVTTMENASDSDIDANKVKCLDTCGRDPTTGAQIFEDSYVVCSN